MTIRESFLLMFGRCPKCNSKLRFFSLGNFRCECGYKK